MAEKMVLRRPGGESKDGSADRGAGGRRADLDSISDTRSWLASNRLAKSRLLDVPPLRYTRLACPQGKTPNIHCKCY